MVDRIVLVIGAIAVTSACGGDDGGLVMISLQGASHARTHELMARGELPALSALAERGTRLLRVVPVDAPATATARATFETGVAPSAHGIAGNTFHVRGDSIERVRSGFTTPYLTETLYEAAARQGLSVATVGIARRDGGETAVTAGRVMHAPRTVTLTPAEPLDTARYVVEGIDAVLALHLDGGRVDLDGRSLMPGEWTPHWTHRDRSAGVWLKLLAFDAHGTATLYVGPLVQTAISAAALRAHMDGTWGPAPAGPDWDHHASGGIDDASWREQVLRETEYLVRSAEWIERYAPVDLLVVALNLLDAHEHQFLRTEPRHPVHGNATVDERERFNEWIEEAYAVADDAVRRLASTATNALVASEYALLPIHSRYQLAAALAQRGYRVSGPDAEVRVMVSSASAHLRINVHGREPTGVVRDSLAFSATLVQVLRALADPVTGERVLARVTTGGARTGAGAGDIRVIARPGYALGHDPAAREILDVPFLPGEHAFDPGLPETHGVFVATGLRGAAGRAEIAATEVAQIVASHLKIRAAADGS